MKNNVNLEQRVHLEITADSGNIVCLGVTVSLEFIAVLEKVVNLVQDVALYKNS